MKKFVEKRKKLVKRKKEKTKKIRTREKEKKGKIPHSSFLIIRFAHDFCYAWQFKQA